MSIEEFKNKFSEKIERVLLLYYNEEIELDDYLFNFYNTGEFVVLGFYDKRLKSENYLEYNWYDQSCFKKSANSNPDTPMIAEFKTHNTVFKNKPIKSFIPIHKYETIVPRKFKATNFIQNWMPGDYLISDNYINIPSEFTEFKETKTTTYDKEDLKYLVEEEIPKFLTKVQNRINLNTIFINSTSKKT